jgi:MarR family transcriptional regulator, organic hydroperoxide resistance regulator
LKRPLDAFAGPDVPRLGDTLEFMRLIWALDHGLQQTSKRMLKTRGVTGLQRLAVRIIGKFPGISAGRLATILHVHPSTLTVVLDRLSARRLVARSSDPRDARRSVLALSVAGRKIDQDRSGTVEEAVSRVIEHVSPERLRVVEEVLSALVTELKRVGR